MPDPKFTCVTPFTKLVNCPEICTTRLGVFGSPTLGEICVIVGAPGMTVNAFASEALSAPVETVMVRAVALAPGVTVTCTVSCVPFTTLATPAVTPPPLKDTAETPCTKLVKRPFTVMVCTLPCAPVTGVILVTCGSPVSTVNPPTRVAVSPAVVSVMVRAPSAAPGAICIFTVAVVAFVTATAPTTVMPAPKFAVVAPAAKFV